jgi:FKBP-type peptidyl-prolyl cis-trans isomerase
MNNHITVKTDNYQSLHKITLAATLALAMVLFPTVCFGQTIDLKKLHERDSVYYHPATNKPYTGKAQLLHCIDCGGPFEYFEMKNGKLHGKYEMRDHGYYDVGYYKDGKKDGIWKHSLCGMDVEDVNVEGCMKIESYKDGEQQVVTKEMEREYFVKDSLEKDRVIQKAKQQANSFLKNNKNVAGVVSTKSGLQYKVLTKGSGNTPEEGSTVTIHYTITFMDGTKMGSTYDANQPSTMILNKGSGFQGQAEILFLMKKGDKVKAWIPGDIASIKINPNYALFILDMELLDIKTIKCGNQIYDSERKFCHTDNKIYDKCGSKPYNPETQLCRFGNVYGKCGNQTYDLEKKFCHTDNNIYDKCGQPYNPETHYCHIDNKVYNKPQCGNQIYDPKTQSCHTDNKIYGKCGNQIYNPKADSCFSNMVYSKCGNQIYDKKTGSCCDNKTAYDPKTHFCCGNQTYSRATHLCHTDNTVKECDGEKIKAKTAMAQALLEKCQKIMSNGTIDIRKRMENYRECTKDYTDLVQKPCAEL